MQGWCCAWVHFVHYYISLYRINFPKHTDLFTRHRVRSIWTHVRLLTLVCGIYIFILLKCLSTHRQEPDWLTGVFARAGWGLARKLMGVWGCKAVSHLDRSGRLTCLVDWHCGCSGWDQCGLTSFVVLAQSQSLFVYACQGCIGVQ